MAIKKDKIKENLKEANKKKAYFDEWDEHNKNAMILESLGYDPSQKLWFWQDFIMTLMINPKKLKEDRYHLQLLTNEGKIKWIPNVPAGKFYYKDKYNGREQELEAELTENRLYHYNRRRYWVLVSGSRFPEKLDNKIDSRKVTDMVVSIDNENKELKLALEKEKNKGIMASGEFWIMIAIAIVIVFVVVNGNIDIGSIFGGAVESAPATTEVAQNLTKSLN